MTLGLLSTQVFGKMRSHSQGQENEEREQEKKVVGDDARLTQCGESISEGAFLFLKGDEFNGNPLSIIVNLKPISYSVGNYTTWFLIQKLLELVIDHDLMTNILRK